MDNIQEDLQALQRDIQRLANELRQARKDNDQDAVKILKAQLSSDLAIYLAARELLYAPQNQ